MKRLLWIVLALGFLLGGCTSSSPAIITPTSSTATPIIPTATVEEIEYTTTLAYYPSASLHPITGDNITNLALSGLVYEGLFSISTDFTATNVLCSTYEVSEDGLVWSFFINTSRTFSDGSAITAEDVAYSLSLAKNSTLYSTRLSHVESIQVVSEEGMPEGVAITLSAPVGQLPLLLDIPIVREQATVDGQDALPPLGTGSYFFFGSGSSMSLVPTEFGLSTIKLYAVTSSSDVIYGFETQSISLVSTDVMASNQLTFSGTYETRLYPTSELFFVGFEMSDGPCADVELRQLLQQAFDREYIATFLLSGYLTPSTLPVSPESIYYDEDLASTIAYGSQSIILGLDTLGWELGDVVIEVTEEGEEIIEQYLMRDGEVLTLDLVVYSDNQSQALVGSYLAETLEALGIMVNLRSLSWESYLAALESGDFDLYLGETRLTATFNLSPFLTEDGALNFGDYEDEEALALLSEIQNNTRSTVTEPYVALYEHLIENPPFITLGFCNWSLLTQWGQYDQCTPTQQNLFYQFEDWTSATS